MRRTMVRGALAIAVATAGALVVVGGAPAGAAAVPMLSFSGAQAIASPDGGTMTFRAKLSAASASTVSVHYATANGTAVAGIPFLAGRRARQIAPARRSEAGTPRPPPPVLRPRWGNQQLPP